MMTVKIFEDFSNDHNIGFLEQKSMPLPTIITDLKNHNDQRSIIL